MGATLCTVPERVRDAFEVSMMTVEEKPDVTYSDIGGVKEEMEKLREVPLRKVCYGPLLFAPCETASPSLRAKYALTADVRVSSTHSQVVETPLLHPERFVTLGIDPPKVCCASCTGKLVFGSIWHSSRASLLPDVAFDASRACSKFPTMSRMLQ